MTKIKKASVCVMAITMALMISGSCTVYGTADKKLTKTKITVNKKASETPLAGDKKGINDVLMNNMKASNDKNLKLYMSTVYKEEPLYSKTEVAMKSNFKTAKIEYEFKKLSIVSIAGNSAIADLTMTTSNKTDENYKCVKIVVRNQLKKQDGKWKIFGSNLISLE